VLGLGTTEQSLVVGAANGLGNSPIDTLLLKNATDPFITVLFVGSNATNTGNSAIAGFFSVGDVVPLSTLLPASNGFIIPDLSVIKNQPEIPLGKNNEFTIQEIAVNNRSIALHSSVSGTPANSAVGILSSTSKYILVNQNVAQEIYGSIRGAELDKSTGLWDIPCTSMFSDLRVTVKISDVVVWIDSQSLVTMIPGTSRCVGSVRATSHFKLCHILLTVNIAQFQVNSQRSSNAAFDISFGLYFRMRSNSLLLCHHLPTP
jgi:hypothetical protein